MPKIIDKRLFPILTSDDWIFINEDGKSKPEYADIDDLLSIFYPRDGRTPDEQARKYALDSNNSTWLTRGIEQGKLLLKRQDFPWRYVEKQANYGSLQSNEKDVRKWLEHILKLIEENLPASPESGFTPPPPPPS